MTKARTATIISAVSVLAVGGLTWQFVLSPRMAEADSINTQAMDVETQNVMLTAATKAVAGLGRPRGAAEGLLRADAAERRTRGADQIMNAATDAGIDETDVASLSTGIPQLVPESEGVSGVQLATMSISVSAEGSATSTMDFWTTCSPWIGRFWSTRLPARRTPTPRSVPMVRRRTKATSRRSHPPTRAPMTVKRRSPRRIFWRRSRTRTCRPPA